MQFTQSQLRASREEYEGANEELRAANEELQSINEEYRSTAEELETSKEELQSINEELQTVNSELKTKLESVSRAHSDMQNLMAATDVGILFLDPQLRINRFTPRIAELFNIAPGDEGRSITDFTHSLDYEDLARTRARFCAISPRASARCAADGSWYLIRLRPYRTVEDKIDGVVVTFVDIGERRRAEDALARQRSSHARHHQWRRGRDRHYRRARHDPVDQCGRRRRCSAIPPDELIGQNVKALAPEPDRSQHDDYIQHYIQHRRKEDHRREPQCRSERKDGSPFPVELLVSEIRYRDERLFIGFMRDLSERRRFEARLSRLTAIASTRWRTWRQRWRTSSTSRSRRPQTISRPHGI